MASTQLFVTAPHATSYDSDYPTRSTENYSHALHEILQDMEDDGPWWFYDARMSSAERTSFMDYCRNSIQDVFQYAEDAITNYRSTGSPTINEPTTGLIAAPTVFKYEYVNNIACRLYVSCMKTAYLIYYMWETEEDPLLLKEKLQQLLIAWPLLDTTIELQNDMGQSFKVYPSWKNCDLDL